MAISEAMTLASQLDLGALISPERLRVILDLFGPQANHREIVLRLSGMLTAYYLASLRVRDLPGLKSHRRQLGRIRSAARILQTLLDQQTWVMKTRLLVPGAQAWRCRFDPSTRSLQVTAPKAEEIIEPFERGLESIVFNTGIALDNLELFRAGVDESEDRRSFERRLLCDKMIRLWNEQVGRPPATNPATNDSPVFKILSIIHSELKLTPPSPESVYVALREFKAATNNKKKQADGPARPPSPLPPKEPPSEIEVTDWNALLAHLAEHPEIRACLQRIANAAAEADIALPGTVIEIEITTFTPGSPQG
jgi:hypothetical protein